MTSIVSCSILSETKPGATANVKSAEYAGFLYTAFSACYGGLHSGSIINARKLIPEKHYLGEIFTDTDWDSGEPGSRERGDYTGFRVKVRGVPMICTQEVHFQRQLPSVKPLSLEAAKEIDEIARRMGWRSLFYGGTSPTWHQLSGHPVAMYEKDGLDTIAVLIWKQGKHAHDLVLQEKTYIEQLKPWDDSIHVMCSTHNMKIIPMLQASLF